MNQVKPAEPNELSEIKAVIAVMSGKGGVGKSLVTSLLAVSLQRLGYEVGILDADLTGPSIPTIFGLSGHADQSDLGLFPVKSKTGVRVMSLNLLLDRPTDPAVWRGPALAGTVLALYQQVVWGDLDVLLIDLPPGTGDVPQTVFGQLPVDAAVCVTTPQQLSGMIVAKAMNMAKELSVPVLAMVENMSYALCPDCGEQVELFGKSRATDEAARFGVELTARIPLWIKLSAASDKGMIELFEGDWLDEVADVIAGRYVPDGV